MRITSLAGLALVAASLSRAAFAAEPAAEETAEQALNAARQGSDLALVRLEQKRRAGDADAPTLEAIIAIEKERANKGDPMTAWRLARRYEFGDGVPASEQEMLRWLKVTASASHDDYPKAKDAAFRLCEAYGRNPGAFAEGGEARSWCRKAAGAGHAAAAIVIARFRGAGE